MNSYALTVLNDLNLQSGTLDANDLDVTIGGDFNLISGTTYITGNNWTVFNGSGTQHFKVDLAAALALNKLKIDKSSGDVLSFAGTQKTINIGDSVMLLNGNLDDNGNALNLSGYIYNSGTHEGSGKIVMNGTNAQVIDGDGTGIFENLELNNTNAATAPVSLATNTTINGALTFSQDKLLNIDTYNLTITSSGSIVNAGPARYIETAGNAGDGGLSITYPSAASITFPVGAPSTNHGAPAYTPASIGFSTAPATLGAVTVIPVGYEHPATTTKGLSLTYFWRIKSTDFAGIAPGSVNKTFTYSQSDVASTEANYVPARYDINTYSWSNGTTASVNTVTNTLGSPWLAGKNNIDGDYTAGKNNPTSPFGTPVKYYSIANGNWRNALTWSNTSGGTPASSTPGADDIVIIENNHTVTLAQDQSCASLQIESGSVLDLYTYTGGTFGMVLNHPNGNGLIRVTTPVAPNNTIPQFFSFPAGDFSDFNTNDGTTEYYDIDGTVGALYILPSTVTSYGNLILRARGEDNLVLPNTNLVTIYGDLTCTGNATTAWIAIAWNTSVWPYSTNDYNPVIEKTVHIKGDLLVDAGTFIYLNNEVPQHVIVEGDVTVASGAVIEVYANYPLGTPQANTLAIGGSLINNNQVILRAGNFFL